MNSLITRNAMRLDLTKEGLKRRLSTPRGASLMIPPGGYVAESVVAAHSFRVFKTRLERC